MDITQEQFNAMWAARFNERTVTCQTCGESWDHDTIGYEEAKERMSRGDGLCPSCEEFESNL